jgi:hypothetical protein
MIGNTYLSFAPPVVLRYVDFCKDMQDLLHLVWSCSLRSYIGLEQTSLHFLCCMRNSNSTSIQEGGEEGENSATLGNWQIPLHCWFLGCNSSFVRFYNL